MAAKHATPVSRSEYTADPASYPKKKRSKAPLGCLIAFLLVLFTVLGVGGYCGYKLYNSAMQVHAEAKWMMAQIDPLKKAIKTGNEELLDETVAGLMEKAAWIQAETHTPLWELATHIPVYGEDIRTAQTLGDVAVTMTRDVLLPISESIGGLKLSSLVQNGSINVELLRNLSDMLSTQLPLINEQVEIIRALPPAHIDRLQKILDKLQDPLGEYGPLLELVDQYLPLFPPMLGADGQTRTYLVIAMGNTEIRSAGGFPGAWGTLQVTDGAFHLGEFVSIVKEGGLSVEMLPGEEVYNFGIFTGPSAVTALPNFNRTGEVAADYWKQYSGQEVDGVIGIDPVALQYLIGLTGEFDTSDGTHIDGTNAAFEILHNVYVRYWNDNDAHDLFFAEVAKKAASTFFSNIGKAKASKLVSVVRKLGEDGRIQVWMAREEEEDLVRLLGFSGEFSHDPLNPVLGIYLNDETYSKIDWFMRVNVNVSNPTYNEDGTATYDVTVVLSNAITYDFANSSSRYITGVSKKKRDVTDMRTTIFFSMPQDAVLDSFTSDPSRDHWSGWPEGIQIVKINSTDLGGTSSTFRLRVTVPAGAEPLKVHVTPLAQEEFLTVTYEYL